MSVTTVLEDVAHGGIVVGRIDGKVVFVTGGLPGETVRVELTEHGRRFDRGRVVEVLEPHPQRVQPPCPIAGTCGGCDWQHADGELQLELKRRVVAEQLRRLAGIEWDGHVRAVEPVWGWRTRMRYGVVDGRLGLRAGRSHTIVELPEEGCRIAASQPSGRGALGELKVVDAASGHVEIADGRQLIGAEMLTERADDRDFQVSAAGFWQVHPRAADTLVDGVVRALRPGKGERAVDLYCGVGLFAGALDRRGCDVLGVELNRHAVRSARRNVPSARFEAASVDHFLRRLPASTDLVVLDPPRKGAGRAVVDAVADMGPRAIAYVACDPAALARDLATFARHGYTPRWIEAYDLFPQTYHVECLAALARG